MIIHRNIASALGFREAARPKPKERVDPPGDEAPI
jgi:hypothetical protein